MSPAPDDATLRQFLRQHLENLKEAGVDWVPGLGEQPVIRLRPGIEAEQSPPGSPVLVEGTVPRSQPAEPEAPHRTQPLVPDAGPVLSPEQRRQALEVLAGSVRGCMRCQELASTRTQTVFGVGKIEPDVCFIGEAPGADEDAQGEPFVGAAGQMLNRIIIACGMKREEVYICNILRCRPPGNRTPLPHEAANCREYLDRQLELVKPRYICCLGACAAQNLLGTTASIGKLRGQIHQYRGTPVMCTYHPSYLLRSPENKKYVWEDMKKLMRQLDRTIP